ncbi:hypothetical protein G5C60_42370 [Streptomyces sp. HC44]|uniref:Uncharacterized protein n=1 Tax=Streptomyces scabichelini TaxID=2711217 RepID=A0A6G4VIZ7_9ACTN|nr:hypothetical protein [Streptomyces scabichelini]NGO14066.1 hypothetical protein [Streptomyces scabichelini]
MNPELLAALALLAPGAAVGTVCLAGHHMARRRDNETAAILAASRPTPPDDNGPQPPGREPLTPPTAGPVATVSDLIRHPRYRAAGREAA